MKKLNSKGFAHHLLIFALLALVVGAAGFAGYRIYKNKNIDAQAVGFKFDSNGLCRKSLSSTHWRIYLRYNNYTIKGSSGKLQGGYLSVTDNGRLIGSSVARPKYPGHIVYASVYIKKKSHYTNKNWPQQKLKVSWGDSDHRYKILKGYAEDLISTIC